MIIHKLVEDGCRPGDAGDIIDDRYDGKMPKEGAEAVRKGHSEKSTSRRRSGNERDRKGNQETVEEERLGVSRSTPERLKQTRENVVTPGGCGIKVEQR